MGSGSRAEPCGLPQLPIRWYATPKEFELGLEECGAPDRFVKILARLEQLDDSFHRFETPLADSENLYGFRQHIDLVRQQAQFATRKPGTTGPASGASRRWVGFASGARPMTGHASLAVSRS
jgi:hypothetical protein